jgi:transposase
LATRRRFTQEYQDQAVSLMLHPERTIRDVAKSIGVHEITLGKWVSKARGGDSDQDKELSETEREELQRLRKENTTLRMEHDFAEKVAAWFVKQQS